MSKLNVTEIEYSELASAGFKNCRLGLRIKSSPETYETDLQDLVIEVKKRLRKLLQPEPSGTVKTIKRPQQGK
jgi:hypothetical protein